MDDVKDGLLQQNMGDPALPSGSRASHEAADASSPKASIPIAAEEASIVSMQFPDDRGGMSAAIRHSIVPIMAENLAGLLTQPGYPLNFIEQHFTHPDIGGITVTIQRDTGHSPAALASSFRASLEEIIGMIEGCLDVPRNADSLPQMVLFRARQALHVAQGIDARSGETEGLDPKGESPVAESDARKDIRHD